MWKPSSVVPHHRNRAIAVWVAILITAFGYTAWQTSVVIHKRQNPSTKLSVSNQQYQFPVVSVCLVDGDGCGYYDSSIDECVASAIAVSGASYGDYQEIVSASQGQVDNCVEFDLTQFQVPEGERETTAGVTTTIVMDWISSNNATAETEYSAGVYVILGENSSDGQGEESMFVPYSRNEISSNDRSYEMTAMTIGKTYRKYLSGDPVTNYPVLTMSTTRFVTTPDFDLFSPDSSGSSSWVVTENSAIGTLFLKITQGSYSHTQVEDIEPLEIGALFGNVGGFWELLVLAWGLFFITKSRDTKPTMKARNFAKVLQRGTTKKRKRRKLDSAAAEEAGKDGARRPDWGVSDDDMHVSGSSDSGESEKDEKSRRHRTHHPAGPTRPIAYPLPRRMSYHSEPGSLGTSATTSSALVQSRRSSYSMAGGTGPTMSSTNSMRRLPGSNAASAANKFNTYDAGIAQTQNVFTVNGSSSFSSNPTGGDDSKARISFFPTPRVASSRIHHDSEDESSRSATRTAAHETTNFNDDVEDADENDLELGYADELEGRHGEA